MRTTGAMLAIAAIAWAAMITGSHVFRASGAVGMDLGWSAPMPVDPMMLVLFLGTWLVTIVALTFPTFWSVVARLEVATPSERTKLIAIFLIGFLLVWELFGLTVYLSEFAPSTWHIPRPRGLGDIDPIRRLLRIEGILMIGIGLYEFSGLKQYYLSRFHRQTARVRKLGLAGSAETLRLGARCGVDSVACDAGLVLSMLIMGPSAAFPVPAVIAVAMGLEKLGPRGRFIPVVVGLALIAVGAIWVWILPYQMMAG